MDAEQEFIPAIPVTGEMKKWLVAEFPTDLRLAVIREAASQGVTVGQWLVAHFQRHGINGVSVARSPTPPASQASRGSLVADLCALAEAAARLAETAEKMPSGLRAALARGLREATRERVPPPRSRQPPPKAISHAAAGP